jgi:hypothetical protein
MIETKTLLILLSYNPGDGKLFWRQRDAKWFNETPARTAILTARMWNTKFAGKQAFTSLDGAGYHHGTIFGKQYYAHRIIWQMCFDENAEEVDHSNGIRSDNTLTNLTNGDHHRNMKNVKLRIDNTSGFVGVSWNIKLNKWEVKLTHYNQTIHLGKFDDLQRAIDARHAASLLYHFHPNHGKPREDIRFSDLESNQPPQDVVSQSIAAR